MTYFILPFLFWLVTAVVYTFTQSLNFFIPNNYVIALFILPFLAVALKQFSFSSFGFRPGKPLAGLFWMIFLPAVLFVRLYFMGKTFHLDSFPWYLVFGSLGEEFFYRGYLQEVFKKFGLNGSFFITNLLFALIHFIKGYSIFAAFLTGLIGLYFSFTKDKQGGDSLFYSMGAHTLYNIVVTAMGRGGPY